MDDIATRLKSTCNADNNCPHAPCLGYCLPLEAANEIEVLRAEVERLEHAVRECDEWCEVLVQREAAAFIAVPRFLRMFVYRRALKIEKARRG